MYKKILTLILSAVFILSSLSTSFADANKHTLNVKEELTDTAGVFLDSLKTNVSNENFTFSYNDIRNYAYVLNTGLSDSDLTDAVNSFITDKSDTVITDSYEMWYTYIIMYLKASNQNPSDFNGKNYVSLLENYYLDEQNYINPYVEQYIYNFSDMFENKTDILNKIRLRAENMYKSDDKGCGMDAFDYAVSVDDNGQCLIILKACDDYVKLKNDALSWTASNLNGDGCVESYGSVNVSSTALALKAFAENNDLENAKKAYNGLMSLKSSVKGAYPGYSYDENFNQTPVDVDLLYSTPDAFIALSSYYNALMTSNELPLDDSGNDTKNTDDKNTDNSVYTESIIVLFVVLVFVAILIYSKNKGKK